MPRLPLAVAVLALARAAAAQPPLTGLWAVDTTLGPSARGTVTLRHDAGAWTMRVGALAARATVRGDSVHATLPDGAGELRGALVDGGRRVDGFWIQSAGPVQGVPYATPLTLARSADAWRGTLAPLDERYTLYLDVARAADGSLRATFRSPDPNPLRGTLAVTTTGDTLRLADPTDGSRAVTGRIARGTDGPRLVLDWPSPSARLTLAPASRETSGFAARAGSAPDGYRMPVDLGDGWRTARAADVGIDEAALGTLVDSLARLDPLDPRAPQVHAMLVARHGRLVLDAYFHGYDARRTHDLRSASKTFVSVLLGAVMRGGASIGPATPVYALFAREAPFAHPDPRKARITMAHLLTHTSGLACDDNDDASPGNEGTMQDQTAQPDWWRYTLDLPVQFDPGTHYAYCSAGIDLAGGAIHQATGRWLPEAFDRLVMRPLDVRDYHVNLQPNGDAYTGGGMWLRPRDLLKLGQLYLDGGVWRGRRIVSADWVRTSIAPHAASSPTTADGYAWHLNTLTAGGRAYREYEANGNGGQFVIVLPALDLAVAFTAGEYNRYGVWRTLRDQLVPRLVERAVR